MKFYKQLFDRKYVCVLLILNQIHICWKRNQDILIHTSSWKLRNSKTRSRIKNCQNSKFIGFGKWPRIYMKLQCRLFSDIWFKHIPKTFRNNDWLGTPSSVELFNNLKLTWLISLFYVQVISISHIKEVWRNCSYHTSLLELILPISSTLYNLVVTFDLANSCKIRTFPTEYFPKAPCFPGIILDVIAKVVLVVLDQSFKCLYIFKCIP